MGLLAFFGIVFGFIGIFVAVALVIIEVDVSGARVLMAAVLGFIIVFLTISSGVIGRDRFEQKTAKESCSRASRVCSDKLLVYRGYKQAIEEAKETVREDR